MKKINIFLLLLFLLIQVVHGQSNDTVLKVKIVADSTSVEKVNVVNARNEKTTVTDKEGVFQMGVQVGDVLVITAVNLESKRKIISAEDVKSEIIILKMNPKINQLKEVNVNENANLNSENLGITPHGQKKYTPAERKLYTATTGILDPLLNKISGRTAMLKKEVMIERNEKLLRKLDGWYEEKYYTEVLKIPRDYIKGFQYYLIEDPAYVAALQAKNKTMTMFLIKRLALNYNAIVLQENSTKSD